MASVNKAIVMGNLGKDPELRYTPSGTAVANFPIATSERYTDKSGQKQERTEWHNIVLFGKQAELANQYLKKGRGVYIEGRISTRSWEDRDGNKRYRTEIVGNQMQFIGGGGGGGGRNDQQAEYQQASGGGFDEGPQASEPATPVEDDLPF